jgi:hypothetical protein
MCVQAIDELIEQYLPRARAAQLDAATLGIVNQPRIAPQDDMAFDLSLVCSLVRSDDYS